MGNNEKLILEGLLDIVKIIQENEIGPEFNIYINKIAYYYDSLVDDKKLLQMIKQMCKGIPHEHLMLLDYLYKATKRSSILEEQIQVLIESIKEKQINLFTAIFYRWQIIHKVFMNSEIGSLFIERSELQRILVKSTNELLQVVNIKKTKSMPHHDRILVVTTQLLGDKHGPTQNTLDYCYTLQKKLKKEVFLLVTFEMPSNIPEEMVTLSEGRDICLFNYEESLEGDFILSYMGENIKGYQCRVDEQNIEELKGVLLNIYNWNPYLVYNLGGDNIIADICGEFTTQVTLPFSYGYPISQGKFLILPRSEEKHEQFIKDYIKEYNQILLESIFVFKLREPIKIHTKADVGIDAHKFVIAIVGNRLDNEISKNFAQELRKLLIKNNNLLIVFIGVFQDYELRKEEFGPLESTKYIGYQDDIRGVLNLADIYLNPPRKGGGTSAVEALAEGIPVITLPFCDVAYAVGQDFVHENYVDLENLIAKYQNDSLFYEKQIQRAKEVSSKVINTEATLKDILTRIQLEEI